MKYRDIIVSANNNLKKNKLRTLLTVSAVFMGALTLMLTTGVGAGLKTYVEEQVNAAGAKDALIIFAATESSGPVSNSEPTEYNPDAGPVSGDFTMMPTLDGADIALIEKEPGIQKIVPLYMLSPEYIGVGDKKFNASISQAVEGLTIPLKAGRLVDVNGSDYEVTLAPALVNALGFASDQDAVGARVEMAFKDSKGELFTIPVNVVGVQEKTLIQGNAMNVNITFARDAYNRVVAGLPDFQQNQYAAAVAKFDLTMPDSELKALKTSLSDKGYSAQTLDDQLGVIRGVIDGIIAFLTVFAAIALAAASFGIVNTLLMAVQERTREIGLMKALGMSRGKIFSLYSLEAVLIGLWGSVIALIVANIIGRLGSNYASETIFSDFEGLELFSFPASQMVPIIVLIMAIAFLAATLPARRASRLDPIEALRYE